MATGKITKRSVEGLSVPPLGKREYLWDETLKGFGAMVTDKGARSYILQYRIGGRGAKTRRVTIGGHGSPWTAETARGRATELLEQVRRKNDPFDAAKAKVNADRAAKLKDAATAAVVERLGFAVFSERFIDKYAKVNQPKSWKETAGTIRRDLTPRIGNRPLTELTDADLVEWIEEISERSASAGLRAYKALNLIFNYACDKERRHLKPAQNPMVGIDPPAKMGKRDRTLSDAELRLVWLAAGGLGWPFGPIIRLLILTAQRRDEVGGLAWPEIDRDKKKWMLPGARSKNGLPNLVPLSDAAMTIVNDLPVVKSDARLMFTTTGETPPSGFSKIKGRLDAAMLNLMRREALEADMSPEEVDKLSIPSWRFHDLRRTLATGCQRLGFPTETTEAVLNHVSGTRAGIVGVYQTYRYEREKGEALAAWARHVEAIVAGKSADVISIKAAQI